MSMKITLHELVEMLSRIPNQELIFERATVEEYHGKVLLRLKNKDTYNFETSKVIELIK